MTKCSVLSLWSGLEEVKGTHGVASKASASGPSGKGKGLVTEASQHPCWVMMDLGVCRASCQFQLPGPISQRSWFADGRGLEK